MPEAIEVGQIWEVPSQWRASGKVQIKITHIFECSIWYQSLADIGCGWTPPYPMEKVQLIEVIEQAGKLIQ